MGMNESLDDRLRGWGARHACPPERQALLAERVRAALEREARFGGAGQPAGRVDLRPFAYALTGALAVLVAAAAWFAFARGWPGDRAARACSESDLSSRDMAARQLFVEAARLFPRQLRWIVQSDGEVGLGVDSDSSGAVPDTPAMTLRLTVMTRRKADDPWREAWTADFMVHAEDLVEITPSRHVNNRLHVWVLPLQNGYAAVETELALEYPMALVSRANSVLEFGRPTVVATDRREGVEYKIIQTVRPLRRTGGCSS